MRGSHRQYKHGSKPGRVTVAGKPGDDLAPGTYTSIRHLQQYIETGWPQGVPVMRYAVAIEKAESNYSAYIPDLPGCVATGATVAEVEAEIRDALRFHIEGMRDDGLPVPEPTAIAEYIKT